MPTVGEPFPEDAFFLVTMRIPARTFKEAREHAEIVATKGPRASARLDGLVSVGDVIGREHNAADETPGTPLPALAELLAKRDFDRVRRLARLAELMEHPHTRPGWYEVIRRPGEEPVVCLRYANQGPSSSVVMTAPIQSYSDANAFRDRLIVSIGMPPP